MFLLGAIGLGVAYALTPIPDANEFARAQATIVYWNDGETELHRFSSEQNRELVNRIDDVPLHVRQAVLAAEDRSFYEHSGFDPVGISRAVVNNLTGGGGGGSTVTQQYVKNYYLSQEQTLTRKMKELFISIKIDQRLSKDQILLDYLNTIWWGRGSIHGVQTASKSYFNKPVSELSLEEGAALAAIIQNPPRLDPTADEANVERFEARFRWVLNGMVAMGAIDQATADSAEVPEVRPRPEGNALGGPNGYLIAQVKQELLDAGLTEQEIETGGLRVVTTFDKKAQEAAVEAVKEEFPTDDDGDPIEDLHVGIGAVRPNDGAVIAMYGGADYVERPGVNNALTALQGGSTIKPFGLVKALEEGISLESRYHGDSPLDDPAIGPPVNNQGDRDYGEVDLVTSTERSINTAFVDLTFQLGYERVIDTIVRAGIPENSPGLVSGGEGGQGAGARSIIGIWNVSPVDLADAYATLAAGGQQADWYTVKRVTAPSGEVRHEVAPEPERVFEADVVADTTYALTQVVDGENGTGHVARDLERPTAGKTGTHDDKTSWFAGYTPQLAATVMYYQGAGDNQSSLRGMVSGGTSDEPFPGGGVPARTWTAFMKGALEGEPVLDFPERANIGEPVNPTPTPEPTCPDGTVGEYPDCQVPEPTPEPTCPDGTVGEYPDCQVPEPEPTEDPEVQVPDVVGRSMQEAVGILRNNGFRVDVQGGGQGRPDRLVVVAQTPGAGDSAPPGSTVTLTVERVQEPPVEPPTCDPGEPDCPPDDERSGTGNRSP
jgi:membrane peptidoglycan carboxypeptidase